MTSAHVRIDYWTTERPTRPDCTHYCRIEVDGRGFEACGPSNRVALQRAKAEVPPTTVGDIEARPVGEGGVHE